MTKLKAKAPALYLLRPLAAAGFSFAAGLLFSSFCGASLLLLACLALALICLLAAFLSWKGFVRGGLCGVVLIFFALGCMTALWNRARLGEINGRFSGRELTVEGRILNAEAGASPYYLIRAGEMGQLPRGTKVLVYVTAAGEYHPGETVRARIFLNEGLPSRSQLGKGVALTGFAVPEGMSLVKPAGFVPSALEKLRERMRYNLIRTMDPPAAALAMGVLLGDDSRLSPADMGAFSVTGTAHILCISGLHISLITGILLALLRRLAVPFRGAAVLALLFTGGFVLLTGANPPAVRAYIMALFSLLGRCLLRENSPLNALGGAVLFILSFSPQAASSLGFWLSVFASLAVFGLSPRLSEAFFSRAEFLRPLAGLFSPFFATVSVNLLCLPVWFLCSGSLSLAALPANLSILPLLPLFLVPAGIAALLGPSCAIAGRAAGLLGDLIRKLALFFAERADFVLPLGFPFVGVWLIVTLVLVLLAALDRKRRTRLLAVGLSLSLLLAGTAENLFFQSGVLTVLNISSYSGGSVAFCYEGRGVLIGCGGDRYIGEKTAAALRAVGVRKVDAFFVPKESRRLLSGGEGLIETLPVAALVSGSESSYYQTLMDTGQIETALPAGEGEYLLFGRFPLRAVAGEAGLTYRLSAYGREVVFTGEGETLNDKESWDALIFYDKNSSKDGNLPEGYAIMGKVGSMSFLSNILALRERFAPSGRLRLFPDGSLYS